MNQTVVMKFGGTSVGSPERIAAVARRVVEHQRRTGENIVVVVSAMSGETDRLVRLSREVGGETHIEREYNQLVSSGEQVTAALTAIAIAREGIPAQSHLAFQLPLRTQTIFGQHLIDSVDTSKLKSLFQAGAIPVVAGFQGVNEFGAYTTLGRGGSDTTAVAVAAALGSCRCIIFTDVDGVYTTLPQWCPLARKLKRISYEEMLELAGSGAKVLQTRSVSLARKFRVPLWVASSFSQAEGTEIVEEYEAMEDAVVSGITAKKNQAMVSVRYVRDRPGIAAEVFSVVAEAGVVVDEIMQSRSVGLPEAISFTVAAADLPAAAAAVRKLVAERHPDGRVEVVEGLAKLAVVGEGMRTHAGVAAEVFAILGREAINIEMITTSEIKITVGVNEQETERAVSALHRFFIEGRNSKKSP